MESTTFSNGTVITSAWLNEINAHNYEYVIYVGDYGAVGDGVTDDSAAIQAAVAAAEAQVTGFTTVNGHGVAIVFAATTYLISTPITVTQHNLSFVGPTARRGAKLISNGNIFNIGDYTLTRRVSGTTLQNLNLVCTSGSANTTAVILYRTTDTSIHNVSFVCWDIGIDCYRASTTSIKNCNSFATGRTTQATAWLRAQGIDETATSGEVYTPGGGFHITDCEIQGAETTVDTTSGILLLSCDGFYMTQTHFTGCVTSLDIAPAGTAANHYIFDVMVQNSYFDEPSSFTSPYNMQIRGSVREAITMASGATQKSGYQGIRLSNCLFRGSSTAVSNLRVQVTDLDSWFDSTNRLRDFIFSGNTFREATQSNLRILGAASGYIEPYDVNITGNTFQLGNSGGTGSIGSAISAEVESAVISGNIFSAAAGNSDYIIFVTAVDSGATDNSSPVVTIIGNDLGKATVTNVTSGNPELVRIAQSNSAGSAIVQAHNNYSGAGREIFQTYKLTTTDATTTNIWAFTIPSSVAGTAIATVAGSNADGTKAVAYRFYVGFRNNGAASSLSSGGASWTTERAWNPDGIATIPSADLSGSTLRVRVTGVAAETWTWSCNIEVVTSK